MNLIRVAQYLLIIAMLINLVMTIRDSVIAVRTAVEREPLNIYYIPSDARLVKSTSWVIFIVAGVVTILIIVKVLPQSFFRLYGSCGFSLIIGHQSFIGFTSCSTNQQRKSSLV